MKLEEGIYLAVSNEGLNSVVTVNLSTGCLNLAQPKYSDLYSEVLIFLNVRFLWLR